MTSDGTQNIENELKFLFIWIQFSSVAQLSPTL